MNSVLAARTTATPASVRITWRRSLCHLAITGLAAVTTAAVTRSGYPAQGRGESADLVRDGAGDPLTVAGLEVGDQGVLGGGKLRIVDRDSGIACAGTRPQPGDLVDEHGVGAERDHHLAQLEDGVRGGRSLPLLCGEQDRID